jgi:mono/diheme cytochrome c family protein
MQTPAPRSLAARKSLFALLLAVIVLAIVYLFFQNRPWTVPEAAKQVRNPLQASDAALKAAHAMYTDRCAHCHGDTGKGDGKDASSYDPAPTNFTDTQRMHGVTDGELFYKISEGHRPMPSFKKRFSEEQRWQLVLLIRSFAAPDASRGDTSSPAPSPSSTRPQTGVAPFGVRRLACPERSRGAAVLRHKPSPAVRVV